MNHPRRLTLRCQLDVHSGYGILNQQTFNELSQRGIYIAIRATGVSEPPGAPIPIKMRSQMVIPPQPEPHELVIYCPTIGLTPGKQTVWYTMWESSLLSPQTVHLLNRAERVIVPCQWCFHAFVNSGVKVPITIVPLGFDPKVYFPDKILDEGPTIFGVAGRVAHCPKRKMIQESIDLFLETFKENDTVRLHVKVHPDDKLNEVKDSRVKIFRDIFEPYQLAHWLRGLTAFVTLSRGEGAGLWALNAMACGRPVIGCAYSGQADYMTPENSFPVKYREVSCEGHGDSNVKYEGDWAEPDLKSAGKLMQTVAHDRSLARDRGEAAFESVRCLTWQNTADKLYAVLEEVGAL